MAILDSGASGHFVLENALVVNKQASVNPIVLELGWNINIFPTYSKPRHTMAPRQYDRMSHCVRAGTFTPNLRQRIV